MVFLFMSDCPIDSNSCASAASKSYNENSTEKLNKNATEQSSYCTDKPIFNIYETMINLIAGQQTILNYQHNETH